MIHGDIKPHNVLVGKETGSQGECEIVFAKLADFGYSAWNMDPTIQMSIYLPKSRPWNAPEHHHRTFTIQSAKQCDIFSFGLTCFWLLFHDRLASIDLDWLEDELDKPTFERLCALFNADGFRSIECLEVLKEKGLLAPMARKFLDKVSSLTEANRHNLYEFMVSGLRQPPSDRKMDIDSLLAAAGQDM